jgi:hypothetical protein
MEKFFKIRFNTDFPHGSRYPWRVIEVKDNVWTEVLTLHVGMHSFSETSTDLLPDGRVKHHISLHPQRVVFDQQYEDGGFAKIEFF